PRAFLRALPLGPRRNLSEERQDAAARGRRRASVRARATSAGPPYRQALFRQVARVSTRRRAVRASVRAERDARAERAADGGRRRVRVHVSRRPLAARTGAAV